MSTKTVSNVIAQLFARRAGEIGLDQAGFCARTGITAGELFALDGRISGDKHLRMLALAEHLPLQLADFHLSLPDLSHAFPDLAALWANCRTPREGIAAYLKYRCVIGELDFVHFAQTPDRLQLDYVNEGAWHPVPVSALGNFNVILAIARYLSPDSTDDVIIDLQGKLPIPPHLIERALNARIRYSQERNRLIYTSRALDRPFPLFNVVPHDYVAQKLDVRRQQILAHGQFLPQIETMLHSWMRDAGLDDSELALERLCEHFHISRWTLSRRLKRENCTFQSLLMRVRGEEARRMLAETDLPVREISDQVGFISQSSLSRFFREQWGISPSHYRAQLR
ncbi:helix-turn-helix transcriptional regulator [Andreprevotia chitinilytica]|uniref:helix-turn-helix transcriptional regulator n=1 Tax=Andreprevotia chitinilytica TaxID=396808 RepID=UPI000552FE72|nr:AraC family transcriptional regulator [Andreprevotia chitinilytica]